MSRRTWALGFVCGALLASGTASAELLCNPEDGAEAVQYRDDAGRTWSLVDFRFDVPAWQRAHLACNRWVESLGLVGALELRALYGGDRPSLARLSGASRETLYRACAAAAPCRVAFPYSLAPDARFQALQLAARFDSGDPASAACRVPSAPAPRTPRAVDPLAGLHDVKTWFTPVTRFADEVATVVGAAKGGAVLVSTMTVSRDEARRIAPEPGSGTDLFLVFDLNAVLADGDEALALFETPPAGIQLVPVFNTPRHPRYYHVKGAASVGVPEPRLVFSGANLKSYDRRAIFDLGFSARGAAPAGALGGLIAREARAACEARETLQCTLDARFAPGSPWRERIRGALDRACVALHARGLGAVAAAGPFLTSDCDALLPALLAEIAGARRSIEGTSHHLDHPELLRALGRRAAELPVHVQVGGADVRRAWVEARAPFVSYSGKESTGDALGGLQPHAKALLVDDRRLVWGSPNFTQGGLGESIEVLFTTEEPALVEGYRRYLATLRHLAGAAPAATAPAPTPDEAVHLWLPEEAQRALDDGSPRWREAVRASRPGLPFFFRAEPALAACLTARDPRTLLHGPAAVVRCRTPGA